MKDWYPASTAQQAAKQGSTLASDIMLIGAVRVGQLCAKYGRRAYIWLAVKENENEEGAAFGCSHCAEMPFLFGRVDKGGRHPFADYKWVKEDYAFMDLIQGYWYNFALKGDPNGIIYPLGRYISLILIS
jgi:para-nitrobenzyl esterase